MTFPRWLRLSLVLPVLGVNLFVLRQVMLRLAPFPALFLAAALIAFLLDIPGRWLQQRGLPRPLSLLLVLGLTISGVTFGTIVLVPLLLQQLGDLVNALPGWLMQAQEQLNRLQELADQRGWPTDLSPFTDNLLLRATRLASGLSQQLLGLLSATLGITVNTLIVLVLAVFLLLGADSIAAGLARWIPADWRELVVGSQRTIFERRSGKSRT